MKRFNKLLSSLKSSKRGKRISQKEHEAQKMCREQFSLMVKRGISIPVSLL